jgi:hypothetical protein
LNRVHHDMHKGLDLISKGYKIRQQIWAEEILFTWRWWFGVGLVLFFWTLWFLIRKRDSTDRLLYAGFFVMVVSVSLDAIGMQFKAWHYLYPIAPVIPSYLPFDLALMPVVIMILIQVKPRVKPIYKGLIFSLLTSFVGEPIFVFLDIYDPLYWKYYYSFPFYLLIYLTADSLSKRKHFSQVERDT